MRAPPPPPPGLVYPYWMERDRTTTNNIKKEDKITYARTHGIVYPYYGLSTPRYIIKDQKTYSPTIIFKSDPNSSMPSRTPRRVSCVN